jgi:hypothetical protein
LAGGFFAGLFLAAGLAADLEAGALVECLRLPTIVFFPLSVLPGWKEYSRFISMPDTPLLNQLKSAESDTLKEILRQAELHLDAQLTAAIAADQRAYTFAGLSSAAAVILVGGSYGVIIEKEPDTFIAYTAFFVAVALFVASWVAVMSARSVDFEFTGSRPGKWGPDIEERKSFESSLAEQCENYDTQINANRKTMANNSLMFNRAANIALGGVGIGAIAYLYWVGFLF